MKKIIAMLLCVAMVAAMGVTAFADEVTPLNSKTATWTVKEWYDYITDPANAASKTTLETYAGLVSKAKAAAQAELDAYNKGIKTAAQAVQAAQYAAVAAYVDVATELYAAAAENALNKTLAEFQKALNDEMKVAVETSIFDDFWPERNK